MKKKLSEKIEIPSGITPMFEDSTLKLRQGQIELVKTLKSPGIKIVAQGNFVEISCDRGNKSGDYSKENNIFAFFKQKTHIVLTSNPIHPL